MSRYTQVSLFRTTVESVLLYEREACTLSPTIEKSSNETGKTTLGHKKKKHKELIPQEAWQKIEERKNIKEKILSTKSGRLKEQHQQTYREADRAVKQLVKRDERKHLEDMAAQTERAAHKGDQSILYKITRQVCGKFRNNIEAPIRNKDGQNTLARSWTDRRPSPNRIYKRQKKTST
ncbi:phosphoinositide phospholipase C [Elysia marginata]|uniref:Phosphoinositide phospholipase C n=1 Tax=Elysia marginata TaxID=1093978 RepID=A0AAV4F9L9_9GAST|nr:phosphoinositide phospholipase C [Elysia marginata]